MSRQYYKTMFHTPAVIVILLMLAAYSLIPCFNKDILKLTYPLVSSTQNIPFFNANYWSFFSISVVTLVLTPLYAIFSQSNCAFFQKESIITRFDNYLSYWKYKMIYLLTDTAIFVLFLYLLILLRLLFFKQSAEFTGNLLNLLVCFPLNITGFLVFGAISQFIYALTGNNALSFFTAYLLAAYDFFADHMGWVGIYIKRSLFVWPNYYSKNLINLIIMVVTLTTFILLFVCFLSSRDCLTPKENKDVY